MSEICQILTSERVVGDRVDSRVHVKRGIVLVWGISGVNKFVHIGCIVGWKVFVQPVQVGKVLLLWHLFWEVWRILGLVENLLCGCHHSICYRNVLRASYGFVWS